MNLTKCSNGHYYDADKYPTCPHCNKNASAADSDVTVNMEYTGSGVGAAGQDGPTVASTPIRPQQAVPVSTGAQSVPLAQAVQHVSSAPVRLVPADDDDGKTVSYYGGTMGTEPVVGWLVCIDGQVLGRGFDLKTGKNFVGRSIDMDIILEGDSSVSRDRHAIITYEPKGRVFIAQPGDSRELFYINEQVVLSNVEMKSRDILTIGNTRLMFIPFCGKDFAWEDLK